MKTSKYANFLDRRDEIVLSVVVWMIPMISVARLIHF